MSRVVVCWMVLMMELVIPDQTHKEVFAGVSEPSTSVLWQQRKHRLQEACTSQTPPLPEHRVW